MSLEWLCPHALVARGGGGAYATYGDPYEWSMTVLRDGETAVLMAVIGLGSRELIRAGEAALRAVGFKRRRYFHNGRWREKKL